MPPTPEPRTEATRTPPPSQTNKPRLGRGLASLIRVDVTPSTPAPVNQQPNPADQQPVSPSAPRLEQVPLHLVRPNPHQPRKQFDAVALAELAESIRANGLIQPVTVRPASEGYELIAGERRTRAARLLGLTTISAIVVPADNHAQAQQALVENIQRQDLNPLDRATGYAALIDELRLTQEELARRMGEQRSTVANYLRLLDLCEPAKDLVRAGTLSLGHAKVLAGVADVLAQATFATRCGKEGWTVRQLEQAIKAPASSSMPPAPSKAVSAGEAHYAELERAFARQLGMRTEIRPSSAGKGRGKLVLHYSSLEEFDRLAERLSVELPDA